MNEVNPDARPLVVHVLFRFDTGGLENGVVNLINHMSSEAYRHVVLSLTEVTDFRYRLHRGDVECLALHKAPGHGATLYPRVWRELRRLKPAIVHTRNLAALEMQFPAWAARVPVRIHGEHGRDVGDLDGTNRRMHRVRRMYAPMVHRFVALSMDLQRYLRGPVGVDASRIEQIYNGVDTDHFRAARQPASILGCPFTGNDHWLVGTVGRLQPVKNQTLLAEAFVRALHLAPTLRDRLRLVVVGSGPLRAAVEAVLNRGGVASLAWLAGERADVADVMRRLDCFVLPSLAEGVSNTLLEAMASGVPVVATDVGGNAEVVDDGRTGDIVPSGDVDAMARAVVRMAQQPERARAMGREGRKEVERRFSLRSMVMAYQRLYDTQLVSAGFVSRGH